MPGLVTQVTHCLFVALDGSGVLGFNAFESLVRETEWNADDRGTAGTSPFVAQVYGRTEGNAARAELLVESQDQPLGGCPGW